MTTEQDAAALPHVISADGTPIAYERTGSGPPLILVHGSINDRTIWRRVVPAFAARYTVYAMDRRGRNESGPPADHDLERQFEDVLAVIDAASAPADVVAHSFGARCALGAALLAPDRVKHLVLYEPPRSDPARTDLADSFDHTDPDEILAAFLRIAIGMRDEQIDPLRPTPFWRYLASFAATLPSENRALVAHGFDPARYASLDVPVLLLAGADTHDALHHVMRELQAHLPRAEWVTFEGQGHMAHVLAPDAFAGTVLEFLAR
jgi:pimeloyl-ACP methyl ester carboxylesterase